MTREEVRDLIDNIEDVLYKVKQSEFKDREEQKKLDKVEFLLKHAYATAIELQRIM
jgi:hypothetical protein